MSDKLKVIGVDAKGYGKVYKVVMRDRNISLTAKALYAYFCSYAGSGVTAFPGQEKISRDLQITKNTLTKHLNFLVDAAYIARQRTSLGNIYEIMMAAPDKDGVEIEVKSMGYGTIPKLAMLDGRLTVGAKGTYAYLCSYAGSGHLAYPRRSTILWELNMGEGKYYRLYSQLVQCGYVTPTQKKTEDGRFASSDYLLNEVLGISPETGQESAEHSDSQKQGHGGKLTDSQKWGYGENEVFNKSFNCDSQKQRYGEGAISQKPMYQKTVPPFLGCANTNNSLHNKQSSSTEEDSTMNIRTQACEEEDRRLSQKIKGEDSIGGAIRKRIHVENLRRECRAWAGVKEMLGHFDSTDGRANYYASCETVIDEFLKQVKLLFERTSLQIEFGGKRYEREPLINALKNYAPDGDELFQFIYHIADILPTIRDLSSYMKCAILKFAVEAAGLLQ